MRILRPYSTTARIRAAPERLNYQDIDGLYSWPLVSTVVVEEGWWMGSLIEELEAREAAARVRVEELEAAIAELSGKLALARDGLERLRITRETVAEVLAEITPEAATVVAAGSSPEGESVASAYAGAKRRSSGC